MLDIKTILIMLLFGTMLMALVLAVGIRGVGAAGFVSWNLGLAFVGVGWLLIAVREALPPIIGVALANAILVSGLILNIAALVEFGGRKLPRWILVLPGLVLFIMYIPIRTDFVAYTMLASVANATAMLGLAVCAWCLGRQGAGPERILMAVFSSLGAIFIMIRAGHILFEPTLRVDLFSPGLLDALTFMSLFAATLTASFAFLMMHRGRAEQNLRRLAMFDGLTEIFNRRAFFDLAERELSRALRTPESTALLMMDLDHFKVVNDTWGHQVGDRVLIDFSKRVQRGLRREDIFGRYGGEEFCVLLPGMSLEGAIVIANRIRKEVEERPLAGLPTAITVSIGVTAAIGLVDLEAMLARSDVALYQAKNSGRNLVVGLPLQSEPEAGNAQTDDA